jgi:RNA polymerase sigma-70 factor (ECF subfamily)
VKGEVMTVHSHDERYKGAAAEFGRALERLARGYEADPNLRSDLLQEIHLALWKSLEGFDGRCSMRTWVYRVAHNAASSYVIRRRRTRSGKAVSLDEVAEATASGTPEQIATESEALSQLTRLIQSLNALDREVILLYLEDLDAAGIAEVTGMSAGAIATRIHRIKAILAKRFQDEGGRDGI